MRIRRGTLRSDKDDAGRVYVLLPVETPIQHDATGDESATQQPLQHDATPFEQSLQHARSDGDQELIDQMRSENEFLRSQIAVKDEQIAGYMDQSQQHRMMIARLEQRILELPANTSGEPTTREAPTDEAQATAAANASQEGKPSVWQRIKAVFGE